MLCIYKVLIHGPKTRDPVDVPGAKEGALTHLVGGRQDVERWQSRVGNLRRNGDEEA